MYHCMMSPLSVTSPPFQYAYPYHHLSISRPYLLWRRYHVPPRVSLSAQRDVWVGHVYLIALCWYHKLKAYRLDKPMIDI